MYDFANPKLAALLVQADKELAALEDTLHAIQEATDIPAGEVRERIGYMRDCGETSVEAFREFDA